jgi:hypothetical protein
MADDVANGEAAKQWWASLRDVVTAPQMISYFFRRYKNNFKGLLSYKIRRAITLLMRYATYALHF